MSVCGWFFFKTILLILSGKNETCNGWMYLGLELVRIRASLVAQLVKNLPAMQETPVQFLGLEDPLKKE